MSDNTNNNDSGGCGCGCIIIYILGAIIIFAIKFAVEYKEYTVPALAALLALAVAIGLIVGLFYAFRSFFLALMEMGDNYSKWKKNALCPKNSKKFKGKFYEEIAAPSYSSYFGGFLKSGFNAQLFRLIKDNFSETGKVIKHCKENISDANFFIKIFSVIKNLTTIFFTGVCSLFLSIILFIVVTVGSTTSNIIYFAIYSVALLCDHIYYSVNKIESRCTNGACKKVFSLPVYLCPTCGMAHKYLRPGKWGIFHRKCVCGEMLPCMVFGKARPSKVFKKDMATVCPACGKSISGLSRPLGVALVGGVNSGKSTFKVAFLYDFIKISAKEKNVTVSFEEMKYNHEFRRIEGYYTGAEIVPETKPDPALGYDITSFDFYIEHDRFSEKRAVQLYDMPGEVFENANAQDRMKHFSYIEGLVFLLDPYSLKAVVGMNGVSGNNDMLIGTMDMNTLAVCLIDALGKVPEVRRHNKKFTIPVAVCINKVDTTPLRDRIGMPAAKKLAKNHPDVFGSEFDALDYLCRTFMIKYDKGNVVQMIDSNFETVHYFSCSSMGYVPTGGERHKFSPENVSAAVNWLFSRVDRQFDTIFDDYDISDISDTQKKLCWENETYYQEIENSLN